MSAEFQERLNQILPRIISDEFVSGAGFGNEIAFFIFDYPPEEEPVVRQHVRFLIEHVPKDKPGLRVTHVNLFDLVLDYLRGRNLLDRSLQMQREKGNETLMKALRAALHENKLAQVFEQAARPKENDLVLVSGVGSVYPLLRSHTLLSNLHPLMGETPLVMFYPGRYDGQSLRLFGKLKNNYYRAFKLVP
jgi:Domain of unknown function (DUF1788)